MSEPRNYIITDIGEGGEVPGPAPLPANVPPPTLAQQIATEIARVSNSPLRNTIIDGRTAELGGTVNLPPQVNRRPFFGGAAGAGGLLGGILDPITPNLDPHTAEWERRERHARAEQEHARARQREREQMEMARSLREANMPGDLAWRTIGAQATPTRPEGSAVESASREGSVIMPSHYFTQVYIGAPFSQREVALAAAAELGSAGMFNTALWVHAHTTPMDELDPNNCIDEATVDLAGIDRASWCVFINPAQSTTGGLHVEFGYALAKGKRMIIIGERSNIFHHLPAVVRRCGTMADAIATIKGEAW